MLALEWRVNYGVMKRLFSTGWKVEAPSDISMPVCLKANFTLHAPGTKPLKNLHFNRIPSAFTGCFWKLVLCCCTLFHISYPGCIISLCQLLSLHCHKRRGSSEAAGRRLGAKGGWIFQSYFPEFLRIVESCIFSLSLWCSLTLHYSLDTR